MIDGYCHCGISKFLPIEDVYGMMRTLDIQQAVLVQHLGEFDNSYLADVVAADKQRFRAVGLFDPDDRDWCRKLTDADDGGFLTGIRLPRETLLDRFELCVAGADLGLVLMIDAPRGLAELLPQLTALLARRPAGVVISHLGYPRIEAGELVAGRELLALSRHPGVHVLLSGTAMWPPEAMRALDEFTTEVIAAFGPERLIWGSNYPPCGGVAGVRADLARITSERWGLSSAELAAVTHENAVRLWFS